MNETLLISTLLIVLLCAGMIVLQSLALRPRYRHSKRFKIINLSVSILILIFFMGITATWLVRQLS